MPTKPETRPAVIEVDDLSVHFTLGGSAWRRLLGVGARTVKAVDGVSFTLGRGEVIGVVGESGSGKSTLGRALLGMAPATTGAIRHHGRDGATRTVHDMRGAALRRLRTDVQMVFQDPNAALNPTMTIEAAVGHPLKIHGIAAGEELRHRVAETLERVGLSPAEQFLGKFPSDLSGGQKQRAVIARAIILDPEVLIADEPVSMLDMSVRAKILQLMIDLRDDLDLSYVYITHDLATAKFFCDRVAIMYLGRIVEIGPTEEIFANPRHPYTKALLRAIPEPDPELAVPRDLPRGEIPDAAAPPLGCAFHPRCPVAVSTCGWESRDLRVVLEEHWLKVGAETFEGERHLVGDVDHLDRPSTDVRLPSPDPAATLALLERVRDADPQEPFWSGVDEMRVEDGGVRVVFHPGADPALRRAGAADVACVHFPDGDRGGGPPIR